MRLMQVIEGRNLALDRKSVAPSVNPRHSRSFGASRYASNDETLYLMVSNKLHSSDPAVPG